MLPEQLSEDLCSLNPNQDKYAVSILIVIEDNKIVNTTFSKSIIHSKRALSYQDANDLITKDNDIQIMNDIGNKLRINGIEELISNTSEKMVETYMILANSLVGNKIYEM